MTAANGINEDDIASVFFTTTPDLDAAAPQEAVRYMTGWEYVPMISAVYMERPGAPKMCIRVLLHWNTSKTPRHIKHMYLRGTEKIRAAGVIEVATVP